MFKLQLENKDTRYFIIDTHGGKDITNIYDDKDFVRYAWELSKYNRVRENDLFIYRRPIKNSEIKEFYFFGAGTFGSVNLVDEKPNKPVLSRVMEYVKFNNVIPQSNEELLKYKWDFKTKTKDSWEHFFNQYGMTEIKKQDFLFLLELGLGDTSNHKTTVSDDIEKSEVTDDLTTEFVEGKKIVTYGYKYERNPKLRDKALELHGYDCKVCGFDFEEIYGELGKGFIEVHHIKPLSESQEERLVDASTDLIPLCPNCHRMIHRSRKNMLSIDELKEIIK